MLRLSRYVICISRPVAEKNRPLSCTEVEHESTYILLYFGCHKVGIQLGRIIGIFKFQHISKYACKYALNLSR